MTAMPPLSHYGLSRERGFLSDFEIDEVTLPPELDDIVAGAENLPGLLITGRVRHFLERLPTADLSRFAAEASDAQAKVAMVRLTFLVQAYVWGEPTAPAFLPANLSIPTVQVADRLGQAPLLPYSAYVLDNWARVDKAGPIDLSNIRMVQHFHGGMDESWFVLVHVAIEARAGEALHLATELVEAADAGDHDRAEALLTRMHGVWIDLNALFDRMPDACDPYVYFHRVRPYIHGWKNNPALGGGLVYEGIDRYAGQPQPFCGQTGSQSSIVPSMDALFGVAHGDDPLRQFLNELHHYRPPAHRRFIEDLAAASRLRPFIAASGSPSLKAAFNACVEQVARFRTRHLEYAASYINKQASKEAGNDTEVGTGGTPFMRYLKKHRDENRAQLVE